MKVGFLNNQIDNRGTGNAVFDYAHYNEEILGNESTILSLHWSVPDRQMYDRLMKRFGEVHSFRDFSGDLDVVYHIKSGLDDGFRIRGLRYVVHAVFDYEPHGDRYAVVSPWLAERHNSPFVPHIVTLPEITDDLRSDMGIRQTDTVFGRHGGIDSFDISWAWLAINRALKVRDDVWFLFMNTTQPDIKFYDPKRVIFIASTANPYQKRAFINTCDAMLHARERGETFGIAVGEFAILGKPILTYALSPERNHLEETAAYVYGDVNELSDLLIDSSWITEDIHFKEYTQYTPENVMGKFKEIFLDD